MNKLVFGFVDELKKTADRDTATIVGMPLGPLAGLAAEKGKGWRTAGGAFAGMLAGHTLGRAAHLLPGGSSKAFMGKHLLQTLMSMGGGGLGARLAHGPDTKAKDKK